MTIYENIKAAISVKQAAEHYGLKASRNSMACCPFHNDRHPSLKLNEDFFFCFGCGAKGDVIDFVARLFDLTSLQAAQKLAADFGLDPKPPTAAALPKPKHPYIRQFREDEMLCFRVLTDYLHLLEDWKVRYAPKTPEDALDDRFVEACQMHCHIEIYGRCADGGRSGRTGGIGGQADERWVYRLSERVHSTKEKGGGAPWRRTGKRLI